jgi:ligand-binding SRPBCC domain-containing protein
MTRHIFQRHQIIPIGINEAWNFFANPHNLRRITPPSMDFKVITEIPDKIVEGLRVEYRVKPLLGIPMKWLSLIKDIKEPYQFVDIQLEGPYCYWHHLHRFKEIPQGVFMEDIIHYEIPYENIFPWVNQMIVTKQLNQIFEFRSKTIAGLLK